MSTARETLLIKNVAVGGQPGLDVRVGPDTVLAVGPALPRSPGEPVLDGAGGAVIPGLHDHHVHLRAAVAARQSVDVSAAATPAEFDAIVAAAAGRERAGGRWVRVTGWHEHANGALDRYRLDALAGGVAVRVQHRGGAMWVLNSAALQRVGSLGDAPPGAEVDDRGVPTGRLLRMDRWLRDRLAATGGTAPAAAAAESFAAGLAAYAAEAARLGVTGYTDATPGRDQADADEFAGLSAGGQLVQRLVLMRAPAGPAAPDGPDGPDAPDGRGAPDQDGPHRARVVPGPVKFILDDATLPGVGELAALIGAQHRAGAAVAVHCVTAEQLVVTVAALAQAGPAGDRIEHAGVVPPGYPAQLARLGLAVVTQPGFVGARGDDYRRDVEAAEQDWLYPCASLLRAGVPVAAGSDAPFGPADPWACMASAVTRRTAAGQVLGAAERVSARQALRLFLADPQDVRRTRTVAPGQPGDLCVLHAPVDEVLARPAAMVAATITGGRVVS
jgi:predicted amidohydrolase YtcJ